LPVVFALDRAGFAGDDGRTHHGIYDLSYLRCLPNMVIMAPKDENELRQMMATAITYEDGPSAVRYPRGNGVGVEIDTALTPLPIGISETIREGKDATIIAVGSMVLTAERAAAELAADGIDVTVVNARFVKPLDEGRFLELARSTGAIVTMEENAAAGGFGAGILELLAAHGLATPVKVLGIPDRVFEQASQQRLRELAGLGVGDAVAAVRATVAARRNAARPTGITSTAD
jgi:1-deoxy-D-xylulose-5-phosphate synthase